MQQKWLSVQIHFVKQLFQRPGKRIWRLKSRNSLHSPSHPTSSCLALQGLHLLWNGIRLGNEHAGGLLYFAGKLSHHAMGSWASISPGPAALYHARIDWCLLTSLSHSSHPSPAALTQWKEFQMWTLETWVQAHCWLYDLECILTFLSFSFLISKMEQNLNAIIGMNEVWDL